MTIQNIQDVEMFLINRFSRLFPAFWVSVTLTYITVNLFGPENRAVDFTTYIINLSMVHEFIGVAHIDGVYWSLSIELIFYFWMATLLLSNNLNKILKILIALHILCFLALSPTFPKILSQLLILKYLPFFSLGICIYQISLGKKTILLTLLVMSSIAYTLLAYNILHSTILIVAILYFLLRTKYNFRANKILLFLGSISYPLYLIHQNIGYSLLINSYKNGFPPLIAILAALLISIGLATIIHTYIEKPFGKKMKTTLKNAAWKSHHLKP